MAIQEEYIRQLQLNNYQEDSRQQEIVEKLQRLQQDIRQRVLYEQTLPGKIALFFGNRPAPLKGSYLWGDVGRGKTWLMDMFYDTLDERFLIGERKIRLHFHHFMRTIHDQLSLISQRKHPLKHIAKAFARRYRVICLDEFHVSDITDAMLLYGLLDQLFSEGIILLATSNQAPDDLYINGLQRQRFLPAIELIKQHTQTLELNGDVDHRLRILEKANNWYPVHANSEREMEQRFMELANSPARRHTRLTINYREILSHLLSHDIIWFTFDVMCGDQRGSDDYIEIARQYHTVFISNIPQMDDSLNDRARRFINMIDEFYDRNVKLLCSAVVEPPQLYQGQQLAFEFRRCVSRLEEMRSHEYLKRPHKTD